MVGRLISGSPRERIRTTSILLEHGGCITYSTVKKLKDFPSVISSEGGKVPESFHSIPRLPMTLAQRVRSIVPSYFGGGESHLLHG